MATTLNAGTSTSGAAISADTTGILQLQSGSTPTTAVTIDASQNLQFNSGYGSVATAYGCRAWVNFNGTGTVAIRASGNVSSITDNGTGNYTLNFTTALTDTNYCVTGISDAQLNIDNNPRTIQFIAFATSSLQISTNDNGGSKEDSAFVNVAIFR
jgi:uncharacterized protein (AIM24 family)